MTGRGSTRVNGDLVRVSYVLSLCARKLCTRYQATRIEGDKTRQKKVPDYGSYTSSRRLPSCGQKWAAFTYTLHRYSASQTTRLNPTISKTSCCMNISSCSLSSMSTVQCTFASTAEASSRTIFVSPPLHAFWRVSNGQADDPVVYSSRTATNTPTTIFARQRNRTSPY